MDEGAPPNDGADKRIYALLAVAEEQQTAVRSGIEGMALERAAMATERVALVQQAERMERLADSLSGTIQQAIPEVAGAASRAAASAVNRALAETATTAITAAGVAAQPTLDGVTNAVKSAAAVQLELKQAVKDFRREWKWAGILALMGMLGSAAAITVASIWLETDRIDSLLKQEAKLTGEVSALQEQADQVKRGKLQRPAK